MNVQELVDELYEVFADRLGSPLCDTARDLPRALSLAPVCVPWSRVFSHEVTLGAPALFAEAMPNVDMTALRNAVLAHLLAVVDAFGTDRVEDEQINPSPGLFAVLGQARRERDRAMARLFSQSGGVPFECDFRLADVTTMQAIRNERAIVLSGRPVDVDLYERASLDKQCAGILGSLGLARATGWSAEACAAVRSTLESIALGLQLADDVVDWEQDLQGGGAWAVCLMRSTRSSAKIERTERKDSIRSQVLESGILGVMLSRACIHMHRARRRAAALGAHRLAVWAHGQERRLQSLAAAEVQSAGYAVRARALAAWASEVLA
jgi:hypothetical protein